MRLFNQINQVANNVVDSIRQVFRGSLNLVKSGDDIQKVQVSALADETLQDVELMQHFGFTSVPPANTEAVIIPIGGQSSHGVVVATEHGSFRVKNLKNGEVAIYDKSGSTIILKDGRAIEVDCDVFKVNCKQYEVTASENTCFNTPFFNQKGGSFKNDGDVVASGKSLVKHKHIGDSGGTTSAPI